MSALLPPAFLRRRREMANDSPAFAPFLDMLQFALKGEGGRKKARLVSRALYLVGLFWESDERNLLHSKKREELTRSWPEIRGKGGCDYACVKARKIRDICLASCTEEGLGSEKRKRDGASVILSPFRS